VISLLTAAKTKKVTHMERITGIGGIFFRAKDPVKLKVWYQESHGMDIQNYVWTQAAGPTVFEPFQRDTDYFSRPEQQWMINFRGSNMDAMLAQLCALNIDIITKPEWDSEIGRFARIHDPEGNPIEWWEPAKPGS